MEKQVNPPRPPKNLFSFVLLGLIFFIVLFNGAVWGQEQEILSQYIRKARNPNVSTVIVFVHGVMGNSIDTWTNNKTNAYWPKMLTTDPHFKGAAVFAYQYPSPRLQGSLSIQGVAEDMDQQFQHFGIDKYKNIIFLTHSMGGLVVRKFLILQKLGDAGFTDKVKMIYFLSTPETGSQFAALASLISDNPQFKDMMPDDYFLKSLQKDWSVAHFKIKTYCGFENQATKGFF